MQALTKPPGAGLLHYAVAPLDKAASQQLLRQHHGFSEQQLHELDLCAIEEKLLAACSGLPLALQVIGGALRPFSADDHNIKQQWQVRLQQIGY